MLLILRSMQCSRLIIKLQFPCTLTSLLHITSPHPILFQHRVDVVELHLSDNQLQPLDSPPPVGRYNPIPVDELNVSCLSDSFSTYDPVADAPGNMFKPSQAFPHLQVAVDSPLQDRVNVGDGCSGAFSGYSSCGRHWSTSSL